MLIKINPQGKPQSIRAEKIINFLFNTKNSEEVFKILVLNLKFNLFLLLAWGLNKIW